MFANDTTTDPKYSLLFGKLVVDVYCVLSNALLNSVFSNYFGAIVLY